MADPEISADNPIAADPVALTPAAGPAAGPIAKRRNGAVWPVIGGVIAAGLGFGLAKVLPGGWPLQDASQLAAQVEQLTADSTELKAAVQGLAAQPAAPTDLADRVAQLEARPQPPDLTDRLQAIEQRMNSLSAGPGTLDTSALKALQDQVSALAGQPAAIPAEVDAAVKAAKDDLAAATAQAQAKADALATASALGQIAAAIDSGAPYGAAIATLAAQKVPAALADHAQSGVPTLQTLREGFPDVARTALESARRADMGSSWTDRIATFLQNQTGARSLTPREGNDPDAVLSRAEAALAKGDLAATVTELAAMPDAAKPDLADWLALAQQRLDAAQALSDLAKALGQ